MSYTSERLEAFNAMAAAGMYGSTLSYGGTDYDCIAEGVDVEKMMAQAAWQPERAGRFSVRATDWTASGMASRVIFTYLCYQFQINDGVKIDPVEPFVTFAANLKK